MRARRRLFLAVAAAVLTVGSSRGAEVRFFTASTAEDFLQGTLEGVGVDDSGRLRLVDSMRRLTSVEEPFVFAADRHPEGWVLGTGNEGRVLLVRETGDVEVLYDADEAEIFAVLAEADGTVTVGTSPDGRVVTVAPDGSAAEVFDPGEKYIWDLARGADGSLLVATGTEGRLHSVRPDGTASVLFDAEDVHIRALTVLADGTILAGTAGDGWVVRIGPDGRARVLHDADQPEVAALAAGPDGTAFAALLQSEATLTATATPTEEGDGLTESPRVTVEAGNGATDGGPRSEVVRIGPDGAVETLHTFDDETVYSMSHDGERLWVGTGLEGQVFSLTDGRLVVEQDVEERQVVGLLEANDGGRSLITTNGASVYVPDPSGAGEGTFTSQALDAGSTARFGSLRWLGEQDGSGATVAFSARSGMTSTPDRTWSEWTEEASGREIGLDGVPPGRFLQWRAHLGTSDGGEPRVAQVEVSYRQANRAPRIEELGALAPGQVLVPVSFNPGVQVFEPAHPGRDGIFDTLAPANEDDSARLKTLWRYGYRTLRWKATDPNDDGLEAALSVRSEGEDDASWISVGEELDDSHLSFDATALPDGVYRFRLEVTDAPANPEEPLTTERISGPVVVDHTPAVIRVVQRDASRLEVEVADASSPLRRLEVSRDGGPWTAVNPVDGLLDERRETLVIEVAQEARLLLLRVLDAGFNVSTRNLAGDS